MKKRYELFLEKSGLTPDEAYDFLEMKIKEFIQPMEDEKIDITFINNLSKEARKWKKKKLKKVEPKPCESLIKFVRERFGADAEVYTKETFYALMDEINKLENKS